MGSSDERVQEKQVVRGTTSEGGYQRVAGSHPSKNNNVRQNFVLGKETGEYKTVSQNYYKWI